MVTSFQNTLIEILKSDSRFVGQDGELLKAAVMDRAWKGDRNLVRLLLCNTGVKQKFFDEVDGHWIFNVNKFIDYVSDKNFLDTSYTRFRNKIGLNIGGKYLRERSEVCLVWPYKDCLLEGGQTKEEERRKEIFFHEVLAQDEIDRLLDPKVLTNWKRYTAAGEQRVTAIDRGEAGIILDNLIIDGNNLLALHCLKHEFRGRVKLIYIDPPYNTGDDDFGYNDSFNHSAWLTFIKNRLAIALDLLCDDGSLWINIGDEEVHYLKVLLDELLPQGFVAHVLWQKRTSADSRKPLGDAHDHILVYSKNVRSFRSQCRPIPLTDEQKSKFANPDDDPKGPWVSTDFTATGYRPNQMYEITTPSGKTYRPPERKCWSRVEGEYLQLREQGRMWFGVNGDAMPRRKTYLNESEGITAWTWWENKDVGHNQEAKHESVALFGDSQPFSTPKPERLLKRIIELCTDEGDIVLDFFAGSGTTAAVALKMRRQFISIEQLQYAIDYNTQRTIKVIQGDPGGISESVGWQGGGEFIRCELMKYNQAFIDRILAASTSDELAIIWRDISANSFLNWYINPECPQDALDDFMETGRTNYGVDKQKKLLCELLNKNQLYVNLSEIDDSKFGVCDDDRELNKQFYGEAYSA